MNSRRRKGHGALQKAQNASIETTFSPLKTSNTSAQQGFLISNLLDLSSLVTAYLFHPVTLFQIYLTKMWPFSTSFNPTTAIPSLAGKIIIVTGGNVGLGQATILELAKHKPQRIYMASRTESKALAAIKEIKSQLPKETGDVDIEFLPLDLSSFASVKSAAQRFESRSTRLDLLILNAGIMATPPGLSESGHDLQLATNHMGHFLLTKLLLPTLQKTASAPDSDVRLISVSSEAFNMSPAFPVITSDSLASKGPWARYGASKAANILFAAEFARRYPAIKSVSLHPGLIKTQLYEPSGSTSNFLVRNAINIFGPLVFVDVPTGAWNQLWASAGSKRGDVKDGAYYTPVGKLQRNKWAEDVGAGRTLWEWTEGELVKGGY